jgi:PAS domain S-box-containing protein
MGVRLRVGDWEHETMKSLRGISLSGAGQQIQHILDALPFYVILVDAGHNIVAANRKLMQDFNLSPQQLIGAQCPIVIHGIGSPIKDCPLVQASEMGEAVDNELFDSTTGRWLQAAAFPTELVTNDGRQVYIHFIRDITGIKITEEKLSQSLEHHSALSDLLQKFQYCQTSVQIMDALIEKLISLSWLGVTSTAVGFLVNDNSLDMVVRHNVPTGKLARCEKLEFGECLCGKAAQTGQSIFGSSASSDHNFRYDGMEEHRHAVIPISHEGRVLGILTLYLKSGFEPHPFHLDFLNAAASAAAAALAGQMAREEVKRVRENSMAQVIAYQEDERKRIARELHDQVCQSLSALLLQMQTHGAMDESLKELQRGCEARIRDLIDEVRKMAGELRPTILDDYGLEKALARHIEELSSRAGLPIDYQCVSDPENCKRLPAPVEVGLYRVALEALDNIVAHASASRASVIILRQNSRLMLLIEDDGCGFDYPAIRKDLDRCLGLIGMEERVALMGGTLRIESMPQKGTTVRAEIPVENS